MPISLIAKEALAPIDVISTTPIHGAGIELNKIPSRVETGNDQQITEQQSLDLTDFMNQNFNSVHINAAQNNPLQPDVQYRGFVASPLLGLPQGMSVFMDGVRINEPFGDTVNWVLIPESAIANINLMAGSNPLFGLNTLGGALSVQTKNGITHPGTRGEIMGGSFGRKSTQIETGGVRDNINYFVTGSWFDEDGWRDYSPSETLQMFGNVGWGNESSSLDLSLSLAETDLIGNGPAPVELLEEDRAAVFTRPDQTENSLAQLRLGGSHAQSDQLIFEGVAYYRKSDIKAFNGDDSDFEECNEPENEGLICENEGDEEEVVFDQNGNPVEEDEALEGATVNRSKTQQDTFGLSLQSVFLNDLANKENQLIIGVSVEQSDVSFNSSTELGSLDETRQAVPGGVLVEEAFTELKTTTQNRSVYFTDTWSATEQLSLTLSGRYNETSIELKDQLGTALNGKHSFSRFNPAAGLTYSHSEAMNFYAGYSESSRAPTPMELTCADPDDPCRLPNAFLSDPPLEQVVSRTVETGIRGNVDNLQWNVNLFQTLNEDDILFISAGELTNQGYFDNVGETKRQGLELALSGLAADQRLSWFFNYTYLEATFEEAIELSSPNNPFGEGGEISVSPGDRLPGVPESTIKAGLSYAFTPKLTLGGNIQHVSEVVLRGDESNLDKPIDSYVVVDARGEYAVSDRFKVFAKVTNLFNEEYETFGLYGEADEVLGGEEEEDGDDDDDEEQEEGSRFLSSGPPLGAWIGIRYEF